MPELPEVETVRLQLLRKLSGKQITNITLYHARTTLGDTTFKRKLKGQTISHIDRIGKLLIICFENKPDLFLLAHLKMTGQFFFIDTKGGIVGGGHEDTSAPANTFPHKHSRVSFTFGDSGILYFNDMRLFGYLKIATTAELSLAKSKYGPEPIRADFDTMWFIESLKRRGSLIKAALLDQTFVAGLGNIYVDEALWRAKIDPRRRANSITAKEAQLLAKASGDVMNESIAIGGTTFQHFVDTDGKKGNFTNHLQVFGKQNTPCPRCKTIIKKIKVAGRGTHYCPKCQK